MPRKDYEEHKRRQREYADAAREERRKWFLELKSTLCCDRCGENHPACLQFHHLDPNAKANGISAMVSCGMSKKTILSEMEKCIVLCANCHSKEHWYK